MELCSAHVLDEVHQHLGHLGAGRGALGIQDAVPLAGEHLRVDRPRHGLLRPVGDAGRVAELPHGHPALGGVIALRLPDVSINKLSTFIGNHVRHRILPDHHHFE